MTQSHFHFGATYRKNKKIAIGAGPYLLIVLYRGRVCVKPALRVNWLGTDVSVEEFERKWGPCEEKINELLGVNQARAEIRKNKKIVENPRKDPPREPHRYRSHM